MRRPDTDLKFMSGQVREIDIEKTADQVVGAGNTSQLGLLHVVIDCLSDEAYVAVDNKHYGKNIKERDWG